jgi:hypothetical protein
MKTLIAIILLSSLSYANPGRPNFTCQTSPNAAGMKIKALVYTFYYSGSIQVDLFHSSTYRDELILREESKPKVHTKYQIKSALVEANESPTAPSTGDDMFIPLPSVPGVRLQYELNYKQGNQWTATFSFVKGSEFFGEKPKQKVYRMNCLKM